MVLSLAAVMNFMVLDIEWGWFCRISANEKQNYHKVRLGFLETFWQTKHFNALK